MNILSVTATMVGESAQSWRIWNIARLLGAGGHTVNLLQLPLKPPYRGSRPGEAAGVSLSTQKVSPFSVHYKLWREVRRGQYDLVYGNTHWGTFCAAGSRIERKPLWFDMHGGLVEELALNMDKGCRRAAPSRWAEWALDHLIDRVDRNLSSRIICVSRRMISYLESVKKVPRAKMVYVTNGIDLAFFKPEGPEHTERLKAAHGLSGKFVIGYIGALDKWQGVENLVRAAELVEKEEDLRFVLVGGEVKRQEGNRVYFPRVTRSEIRDYYTLCDVLVLPRPAHPATEMAAPTKFAEYSAMGKPVLTTRVGDAADLIEHYRSGLVVRDNSPRCLADGCLEIKSRCFRQRQNLEENSRRLAEEEFDWNTVGSGLLQALPAERQVGA